MLVVFIYEVRAVEASIQSPKARNSSPAFLDPTKNPPLIVFLKAGLGFVARKRPSDCLPRHHFMVSSTLGPRIVTRTGEFGLEEEDEGIEEPEPVVDGPLPVTRRSFCQRFYGFSFLAGPVVIPVQFDCAGPVF